MIKESPILMSTDMAQATLDGRKTQTRRITGQFLKEVNWDPDAWTLIRRDFMLNRMHGCFKHEKYGYFTLTLKSYGAPGDVLWVRESFCPDFPEGLRFKTEARCDTHGWNDTMRELGINWKPSIHMPKEAARIWLKVVDIRIERLHSINEWDALAEGIMCIEEDEAYKYDKTPGSYLSAISAFTALWDSINGPLSWENNPWVYVIEYEVLSTTGKPTTL